MNKTKIYTMTFDKTISLERFRDVFYSRFMNINTANRSYVYGRLPEGDRFVLGYHHHEYQGKSRREVEYSIEFHGKITIEDGKTVIRYEIINDRDAHFQFGVVFAFLAFLLFTSITSGSESIGIFELFLMLACVLLIATGFAFMTSDFRWYTMLRHHLKKMIAECL